MSKDQIDYDAIERRVRERVNKRKEFIIHLSVYLMVNIILWLFFLLAHAEGWLLAIPLLTTLGWGIGLMIHGTVTYLEAGGLDSMHARMMKQEINRERMQRSLPPVDDSAWEKPKRDRIMRLSDDGELVEEEDQRQQQKQK